jgi:hypothetical protein
MSYDLILKNSRLNWSRDQQVQPVTADAVKTKLEKLGTILMAAKSGDRKAQKQWKSIEKKMRFLVVKAKKGDTKAKLEVAELTKAGFLNAPPVMNLSVSGEDPKKSVLEVLQQAWGRPLPIAIDQETAAQAVANGETVNGVPFKAWLAKAIKDKKVVLADQGMRIFEGRFPSRLVVADQRPFDIKVSGWGFSSIKNLGKKIGRGVKKGIRYEPIYYTSRKIRSALSGEGACHTEILGSDPCRAEILGEEERALVEGDGFVSGTAISHDNYRLAVLKATLRSSKGQKPTTADFAKGKKAIDQALGKAGTGIYLPGAQPGRRTV